MIRIALIGAGAHAVEQHLPAIQAAGGATVSVVCDRDAARAAAVAQPLDAAVSGDWRVALACDVDAVMVCTPPTLTPEIALAAAGRGLPVLLEKPLAADLAGAERLCAALAGRPAMASMNRRFDPAFTRLRTRIGDRPIHQLRGVLARRGRREPGFAFLTGVHLVDLLVHLAGPPAEVGRVEAVRGGWCLRWRSEGGTEVVAELRPCLGIGRESVEAAGDGWCGEARSAWFDDGLVRFRTGGARPEDDAVDPAWPVWRRNGTDAEIAAFLAACAGRGSWAPRPEEVLPATRLCAQIAGEAGD